MTSESGRDKRRGQRFHNDRGGQIEHDSSLPPIACIVKDISQTGARLNVENGNWIPDVFKLHFEGIAQPVDCMVVRRATEEVGVIFEAAPLLR